MAGCLLGDPSYHGNASAGSNDTEEEHLFFTRKWYFTKEEIEEYSPSRKDGITFEEESHLRKLYCSYLLELGMELKVPQVSIATATMFCHRFFMRQSHAKNYWQTVAAASMLLASKAEETTRRLSDIVLVSYKLAYKWDPHASQRIRQKEIYDEHKETILLGERLLLATLAFHFNIEHPYKPLVAAVKKLEISQKELVMKVAWNYVNDWLHTTLCLQYKPHYVAAGSLFLAAKSQNVKLPKTMGNVWWMQFDVSPTQLEAVIQQMISLLKLGQKQQLPSKGSRMAESQSPRGTALLSSPESCISNGCVVSQDSNNRTQMDSEGISRLSKCCQIKQCIDAHDNAKETGAFQISSNGTPNSIVEHGEVELKVGQSEQNSGFKIASFDASLSKVDVHRIREQFKKRRLDRNTENKLDVQISAIMDDEAWIERELESGV